MENVAWEKNLQHESSFTCWKEATFSSQLQILFLTHRTACHSMTGMKKSREICFLFSFIPPKIPKINAHRSPCFFLSVTMLHELPDTTGTQWLWLCIKPQTANGQSSLHWWHLFCHLELFHPLLHISLCHIFFCSANILQSIPHPLTTHN